MNVNPLVKATEIQEAYEIYNHQINTVGQTLARTITWRGNYEEGDVIWHPELRIWSYFDPRGAENRYWCAFGIEDATQEQYLNIACEINIPYSGVNRRIAGLFVRDSTGKIYLTHSGKVGGGRSGIGKIEFLNFYHGDQFATVVWDDGSETETILIGQLDSRDLLRQVAYFVHEVDRFKQATTSAVGLHTPIAAVHSFSPEFFGQRQSYTQSQIIQSICNHGRFVKALRTELDSRSLNIGNTRYCDLFTHDVNGKLETIFELKTDLSTTSIYEAVGQLMFHGAIQDPPPERVLVVPEKPKVDTAKRLKSLGIKVVTYKKANGSVQFKGLNAILP